MHKIILQFLLKYLGQRTVKENYFLPIHLFSILSNLPPNEVSCNKINFIESSLHALGKAL